MKYNNKCNVKLMNLSSGKIHHNGLPSCYVSSCLTSAWKTIYRIYGCNEMSGSMVIQQNHSAIFLSIIFFQCVPCWGDFRLKFNTSIVWTKQTFLSQSSSQNHSFRHENDGELTGELWKLLAMIVYLYIILILLIIAILISFVWVF